MHGLQLFAVIEGLIYVTLNVFSGGRMCNRRKRA